MNEFQVAGQTYRSGKINAKQQMHVMRRLAPVLPQIGAMAASFSNLPKGATVPDMLPALAPLATAVSQMSDEDCDYVLDACLSVVQRQQGERWAPFWNEAAGAPQFSDVELPAMLMIAGNVLRENLSGFFAVLSSSFGPPAAPPQAIG